MSHPSKSPVGDAEDARRLRAVFDGVVHLVGLLTPDGVVLEANRASLQLAGARREEVVGRPFWETPWWPRDPARQESLHAALRDAASGTASRFVMEHAPPDGQVVTLEFSLTPVHDEEGRVAFIIPEARDVTARRAAERALRESEARLAGILSMAADAIVSVDEEQRITLFNRGAETIFGYAAAEVLGQPLTMLLPDDRRDRHAGHVADFAASADTARFMNRRSSITGRRRNGEVFPAEATISRLDLGEGRLVFTAVLRDVSERKRAEEALRAMSLTDELTGLYNRRGFLSLAPQMLRQARRSGTPCLLIFIDLDDLKPINDTHGHLAGDRALAEVGTLLREVFRESDLVARYGGDEFVVLSVGGGVETLAVQRARLQQRLGERSAHPDLPFRISLSLGVAAFDPEDPLPLEQLMRAADEELYREKGARRRT